MTGPGERKGRPPTCERCGYQVQPPVCTICATPYPQTGERTERCGGSGKRMTPATAAGNFVISKCPGCPECQPCGVCNDSKTIGVPQSPTHTEWKPCPACTGKREETDDAD